MIELNVFDMIYMFCLEKRTIYQIEKTYIWKSLSI